MSDLVPWSGVQQEGNGGGSEDPDEGLSHVDKLRLLAGLLERTIEVEPTAAMARELRATWAEIEALSGETEGSLADELADLRRARAARSEAAETTG